MKSRTLKSVVGLLAICLSMSAVAQTKDTTVALPVHEYYQCQVSLAGRLSMGSDSTYEPMIKLADLLNDPVLKTAGCANYTITSFTMVIPDGNSLYTEEAFNDHLTSNMIALIQKAQKVNGIIIKNVHYKMPNGQTGVMGGMHFSVN
jgi:hypothetical protein